MTGAQLEYYRRPNYLTWLRAEASLIDTDGCSGVSGVKVECCYEHDLHFYHGKDVRRAYQWSRCDKYGSFSWRSAPDISFNEANRRFRKCLQARSKMGRYSPMALWRWAGVALFSRKAWDAHRAREQAAV